MARPHRAVAFRGAVLLILRFLTEVMLGQDLGGAGFAAKMAPSPNALLTKEANE